MKIFFFLILIVDFTQQFYDPLNLFKSDKLVKEKRNIKDRKLDDSYTKPQYLDQAQFKIILEGVKDFPINIDETDKIVEYELLLNEVSVCENSFLNSLLEDKDKNYQIKSEKPSSYMQDLCPNMEHSCCSDSLAKKINSQMDNYYKQKIEEMHKLKKFVKFFSKIDDIVFNHLIRNKKKFNKVCFPESDKILRAFIQTISRGGKEIVRAYGDVFQQKYKYSVDIFCSLCDAKDQKNFKINLKTEKYEVFLDQQEVTNFLKQDFQAFYFDLLQQFFQFVLCIHKQIKINTHDPFYQRPLITQPSYHKIGQNFDLFLQEPVQYNYFVQHYQFTKDQIYDVSGMIDAVLDLFLYKQTSFDNNVVSSIQFWQASENLKLFHSKNIDFHYVPDGFQSNSKGKIKEQFVSITNEIIDGISNLILVFSVILIFNQSYFNNGIKILFLRVLYCLLKIS